MPLTTLRPNYLGSNPTQGRTIKTVTGGLDRAGSADAPADVVGFGYTDAASGSVRTVDVGQVWAVELDPMAPDVTTVGVPIMVTANGLHQAKEMGDTGLSIGSSAAPPLGVPNQTITFMRLGKKWCWVTCAPHTET